VTPAGRLRAAADTIDHTAGDVARTYPGRWEPTPTGSAWAVIVPDRPGASRVAACNWSVAAEHVALWDPPTAHHAATLLRTIAGYVDEADRLGLSVVEGDLTTTALALADAILTGADVPA
jgi:hypothetical protein